MVQMHAVNTAQQAGTRKGKSGASNGRFMIGIAAVALVIVMLVSLGVSPESKKKEKLEPFVVGQVHHVTSTETVESTTGEGADDVALEKDVYDSEAVDNALGSAEFDIEQEGDINEEEEEAFVDTKVSEMETKIRDDVELLIGGKVPNEEISEIEEEVVNELRTDAFNELKVNAEGILNEKIEHMEEETKADEAFGWTTDEIRDDIKKEEKDAKEEIRDDLHKEAMRISNDMQQRAINVEKEILEKRLSQRLGKIVHLIIEEDTLKDIDHLVDDLPALTGQINFDPPNNFAADGEPANLRGSVLPASSIQADPVPPNQQDPVPPNQQAQQFLGLGAMADDGVEDAPAEDDLFRFMK